MSLTKSMVFFLKKLLSTMYPGTQSKMVFFFFFFFLGGGGGGEGDDFYEDLTPKAHSTTLAKL